MGFIVPVKARVLLLPLGSYLGSTMNMLVRFYSLWGLLSRVYCRVNKHYTHIIPYPLPLGNHRKKHVDPAQDPIRDPLLLPLGSNGLDILPTLHLVSRHFYSLWGVS